MRAGGAKAKGNKFEALIAKELAKWYYNDENALIRNSSSGALSTFRKGETPPGDIVQAKYHEKPFPFNVECKHWSSFSIEKLIFENLRSKEWKAIVQSVKDAEKNDLIPALVWRENNGEIYIAIWKRKAQAPSAGVWHICETQNLYIFTLNHFIQDPNILMMIPPQYRAGGFG